MIRTSSRTRVAITAAGGTIVAAITLGVIPAAHADDESWGAIAVSPDGKSVGVATDSPNEYQANVGATSQCQENTPTCNVLITFKSPDCGAVVKNNDQYFGDSGATQQEAEQNAMNQSPGSTALKSTCNNPAAGESTTPTSASATPTDTSTTSPGG